MTGAHDTIPASFRMRFPAAAEAAASAPDRVVIERAASGAPTGRLGGVRLCSAHDPDKEALRFVAGHGIVEGDHVALYGVGLGRHLTLLLDAVGASGRVVAVEANASILRAALRVIDKPEIFADERLIVVAGTDETSLLPVWSSAFSTLDPARTKVVIHLPSFQSIPDEFPKTRNAVEMIRMERRFPVIMGGRERENFHKNLPALLASHGVAGLGGAIEGGAAAVVGAGPSLDRSVMHLAGSAPFIILSTDTALPVLLRHGVKPHLVFTADPQTVTLAHFELAGEFGLPLILVPTANADVVARWTGPLFFGFIAPDRFPEPARAWAESRGVFRSGGSVSLLAMETALLMGAHSVVLFGHDFGYPNDRMYATGSLPSLTGATLAGGGDLVFGTDHFGRRLATSRNMYVSQRDVETMAGSGAARFYTLSTEGPRLSGVEPIASPAQAALGAAPASLSIPDRIEGGPADPAVERAFLAWLDGR